MVSNDAASSVRDLSPEVLGELVGLLTHDLRNPLAALASNLGFLGMVSENLGQDVREALVDLQLSVEVLTRIADAMEVVSQDLRMAHSFAPTHFPVGSILSGLRPAVERAAQSHGVTLRIDARTDARIVASEPSLSRAIAGLLHNSITLSPAGSEVVLDVRETPEGVRFRVEDRGPVLAPEFRDAAFSAEGQVSLKGKGHGRYSRGLGLYVVGRTAQLAGAKLRIDANHTVQGGAVELLVPLAS